MKLHIIAGMLGIGSVILAFAPVTPVKTLKVNPEASTIEWFAEKVTGKHNGTVSLQSGNLQIEDGKLTGGEFIVDMTSITVTDLEGEYKKKLEGHLKSEDFFATEKHPTSRFEITAVKYTDAAGEGFNAEVTGNLTIKDITHPLTFPARIKIDGGKLAAFGKLTIDRTKYNVRYGSSSFFDNLGDKAIYDEFRVEVSLGGSDK